MKVSLGPRTHVFPTPTWIVCTFGKDGKANGAAVAWGGICCSKPPCIAVSLRAATYTHGCIMERKAFTVNVPSERYAKEADYFGVVSGRDVDKFAVTGLTPVKSDLVDAPYVKEFPLALECRLAHVVELGLHTQFVGEIVDVKADDSVLAPGGMPDIDKVKPFAYDPSTQTYVRVGGVIGKAFSMGKEVGKKP